MNLLSTSLVCPACSAKFKLAEATRNIEVLELARLAAKFGPDWSIVESYLACFRTDTGRGIRPERLRVLLEELVDIWQKRSFTYQRKVYQVHADVLRSSVRAVGQMCDTKTGFRNHNYLLKVMIEQQKQFRRAQARAEGIEFSRDRSGASREEDDCVPPPDCIKETVARLGGKMDMDTQLNGGQDG